MDKLAEVLGQLAQQLGMTADRLWPRVVMVTYYRSLVSLVIDLAVLAACVILPMRWLPSLMKSDTDAIDSTILLLFGGIGIVAIALICIVALPSDFAGVMDPEGSTVYRLLGK